MQHQRVKAGHSVLYVTPTPTSPPEVSELESVVGTEGKVKLVTHGQDLQELGTYDVVISVAASAENHDASFLAQALKALKPGGTLILREPLLLEKKDFPALRDETQVRSALTLAGFLDVQASNTQADVSLATGPRGDVQVATFEIIAAKPEWDVGAKATLSFGLRTQAKRQKQEPAAAVWTLSSDDTVDEDVPIVASKASNVWSISGDDDAELEDDSALLSAEDLRRPSGADLSAKRDDCEIGAGGKKKACKNCTCGRADGKMEDEEEEEKEKPKAAAPKSSCGSCYLGDAFRCASCPYKGLPPFKPGDKVSIAID